MAGTATEAQSTLELRAAQVLTQGCTTLGPALSAARIEALRIRFLELIDRQAAVAPVNRGVGRHQMYLPWEPPFDDPDLFADPEILALVERLLGTDPALVYHASDTPLPGSEFQRVHSDTRLLFPEYRLSLPPYGLVLNIPLVECSETNGSLEYWPGGTHLWPGGGDMEQLAAGLPSRRANMPAGSRLLRDLRMWHRGTPNRGDLPRPHLAWVYVRPWYRFEQQPPRIPVAVWEALPEDLHHLLRFAIVER